ncbi:hypothetical protein [Vibrio alginolyticus]|uniref:hypothetical protein n=1 Tax=Vibrio alginolyticus TaxID=663 RepID=UPI000721CCA9|nr:hypothetical protein [Vibrio alginolyticus]ALR91271.1 hypothetical protein AT730_02290 [Vibrio alginolyticus]MBY7707942.1 hypothetical protein [Vibrio alginolyticus]
MAFTLRTTDEDEKALDAAAKYFKSSKKQDVAIGCIHLVPTLKSDIRNLEREVYRLQCIEKEFNNVKGMLKNLVS